ncbi:MAG: exonuclease domain-containing protein [Halanaerobiales bacterium]
MIEVAGIVYDTETEEEEAIFHEYIKPGKKISPKITEITGITNEQVADKREEMEVLEDFFAFVEDVEPDFIVGHNYNRFDKMFLESKANTYFFTPLEYPTIDTLNLAKKKNAPAKFTTPTGRKSYRQESIAAGYGIEYEAHSAINDVRALIEIYKKMTSVDEQVKKERRKLGF